MRHWPNQKLLQLTVTATLLLAIFNCKADVLSERTILPLPKLPAHSFSGSVPEIEKTPQWQEHKIMIRKNESLSTALGSLNISPATTYEIGRLQNSNLLTNLNVGDELEIWVDKDQNLQKILYPKSQLTTYELVKTSTGYQIQENKAQVEIRTETAYGTINGSFYIAAQNAGLSARSIMNLADLFAWDIDFARELRDGDVFKVIYEAKYLGNKYIGDGDILAAQIITENGNNAHNAFIMRDNKNVIGYYDEKGKNLKKAFLRSPVDYVRITSKFTPRRFHPILKKWRSHRGVDYGGPIGTPIHVTGSGKIIYEGWGPGYGRHIKVQHAGKYMTLYGHLSKYGKFKKGSYVSQGQTIGYMGMSGLATGPHLHYEFRIHGKHVDPLKVKFPAAGPIDKKYRVAFKKRSHLLLSQLDRLDSSTYLARNFE
jgi:murein DD-endopeptidase MepM/ murein hydrolase activator NlpD